jgi:hypothetical protein
MYTFTNCHIHHPKRGCGEQYYIKNNIHFSSCTSSLTHKLIHYDLSSRKIYSVQTKYPPSFVKGTMLSIADRGK